MPIIKKTETVICFTNIYSLSLVDLIIICSDNTGHPGEGNGLLRRGGSGLCRDGFFGEHCPLLDGKVIDICYNGGPPSQHSQCHCPHIFSLSLHKNCRLLYSLI